MRRGSVLALAGGIVLLLAGASLVATFLFVLAPGPAPAAPAPSGSGEPSAGSVVVIPAFAFAIFYLLLNAFGQNDALCILFVLGVLLLAAAAWLFWFALRLRRRGRR